MGDAESVKQGMEGDPHVVEGRAASADASARRVWIVVGILSLLAGFAALGVWYDHRSDLSASTDKKEKRPEPVQVTTLSRGTIPLTAEYRGELRSDFAELSAQGTGRLVAVEVDLGDSFEKGALLARVDAAETNRLLGEANAQAEAAVAAKARATAELEAARKEADRGERLLAESLISEQELLALKSSVTVLEAEVNASDAQRSAALARVSLYREQLSQAELRAPFSGKVAKRYLDPGAMVQPATPILRLVASGPLDVTFRASEAHLPRLSAGVKLSLSTLGSGEKTFDGRLLRISAEVSRTDRSVEAEGRLDAEHEELRPGMYASVKVSLGTLENHVLVPAQALTSKILEDGSSERGIFAVRGETAKYIPVDVVGEHEGQVAVKGAQAGERVVVHGQDLLSDGAKVRITTGAAP